MSVQIIKKEPQEFVQFETEISPNKRSLESIGIKIEDINSNNTPPLKRQRLEKKEIQSTDEVYECFLVPVATTPRDNNIKDDFHPEKAILSHLTKAKKSIRISMAYWKSISFSQEIKKLVCDTDTLKHIQWQIILSAESIYNKEYFKATKILSDIANNKQYSHRFQCKIVFGLNHFAKMHWKWVSIDSVYYYTGSWQPTYCASYQNEEIGGIICPKKRTKIVRWEAQFERQWNYTDSMNLIDCIDMIQQKTTDISDLQNKMDELYKSKKQIEKQIEECKKQMLQKLIAAKKFNKRKKRRNMKCKKKKKGKNNEDIAGRIVKFVPKFDFENYFLKVVPTQNYKINIPKGKIKWLDIGDYIFFQFDSHIRYISTVVKGIYVDSEWDSIKYPKCCLAFNVDKNDFIAVRYCMRNTKENKSRCYNKLSEKRCIELKNKCLEANSEINQNVLDKELKDAIFNIKNKAKTVKETILRRVSEELVMETGIISDEINDNTLMVKHNVQSLDVNVMDNDKPNKNKKMDKIMEFDDESDVDEDNYDNDEDFETSGIMVDIDEDIDMSRVENSNNKKRKRKKRKSRYNLRSQKSNESDDYMIDSDEDEEDDDMY